MKLTVKVTVSPEGDQEGECEGEVLLINPYRKKRSIVIYHNYPIEKHVYSHIATADRKRLAVGIDPFFANLKENPQDPEAGQSSTEKILSMLKKDPDKAEKVLKMLELLG